VAAAEDELLVRQLLQWRTYARRRGLESDLVILDQRAESAERLRSELQAGVVGEMLGKPGGVFVLGAAAVSTEGKLLLAAAARAVCSAGRGSLATQMDFCSAVAPPLPPLRAAGSIAAEPAAQPAKTPEGLRFWNGIGGFTRDGREYVILI